MERYAASVGCRHRHLAEYFGDRYAKDDCGACDYCLDELEAAPAPTVLARQILSCVARVGQRFGALHVANVLRGQASEQVIARAHDKLSTFGLLRDASVSEVRGYIQQLTALGLLRMTDDPYAVLVLTAKGLALLKDEASCPGLVLARQRHAAQGRAPNTRARRDGVVGRRRPRAVRAASRRAARDRAPAWGAALRHLSRRDAS